MSESLLNKVIKKSLQHRFFVVNVADLKISLYICLQIKTYFKNFAFLILRIIKLFALEVCKFQIALIFNIFYCFWKFVNKLFTYFTCTYRKRHKVFQCEIFNISFSYEDEDIGRFSNMH